VPALSPVAVEGDLRTALQDAETRLAHVLEERDRTLAAVGHDVRTPLNGILGIVALLLDGDLEESQRRWLLQVRASCEVLLAMLNGMLEAASAISDGRDLNVERLDVGELVHEVVEVFRPMAHDKGLELSCEVEDGALGSWLTDATRLRQVACNLVGNSIKFTGAGSVQVVLARSANGLCLAVSDTGPGISDEERPLIFQRFVRGRADVVAGHEGLGLGLALCQEIAGLMGGSLEFESAVGSGTTFRFAFRTDAVDRPRTRLVLRGRTALVIGLSEGVRRRTVELLERLGGTVDGAPDGFIGLGLAERAAHEHGVLDLVVLDAAIAGLPAEAVLARLGASRALKSAKVVLVGGDGRTWPGVDALLPHPVEDRHLLDVAGKLFAPEAAAEGAALTLAGSANARVLVAEDNSVNRALLLDVLGKADFTVFGAKDGEEAVQAASRGGFDAIVMDVQMPVLDGIEAMKRVRAVPSMRHIPILALTAHTGAKVRRACLEAGATAVLHKPTDLSRLVVQLHAAIEAAREAQLQDQTTAQADDPAPGVLDPVWLDAFIIENGWPRARALLETMLCDRLSWSARTRELIDAGEWSAAGRASADLSARASEIGAMLLAEALDTLQSAAAAGSTEQANVALAAVLDAFQMTAASLAKRLQLWEAQRRRSNDQSGEPRSRAAHGRLRHG
jgi:CheY-like chemotaxis protein/two-component sensor histidine kinase